MSKLTDYARGRDCQVRIPNVCNRDPATTVLAHMNGAGWALKSHDIHGAHCCSACHAVLDGHAKGHDHFGSLYTKDQITLFHLEGVIRTQTLLLQEGLIAA